jgi:hypothetical protein
MWDRLRPYFKGFPAQEKVAQLMVRNGLRVGSEAIYSGDIALSDSAIARAAGVDRRVVTATVQTILRTPALFDFFQRLTPTCHLKDIATLMHWGAIEILPDNAARPGILAGVASVIAEAGVSIRQVVVDDPEIIDDPRGFIITEAPVPERLLPRIKAVSGVRGVVIH